jgi:hypothetical protein
MNDMKPISIYTSRAIALAAVLVSAACIVGAADDAIPRIQMDKVPLADAIRNLARQSNLNYILDPHVPGSDFGPGRLAPKLSVTASWTNATAQAALSALLKEHSLTMVTNPATTVTRIAPANLGVKPVPASQVGTNPGSVIPMVSMDNVPLTDAITRFATLAEIKITIDPQISSPAFDSQGTVSFRWERLTARQGLVALLDNYGLKIIEDAATSTARVALKATTTGASDVQAAAGEQSRFLAAAEQAFEKKDVEALLALVCWDRVPDKFKESRKKQFTRDVSDATDDIALTDPDPNYPDHEWKDKDGVSYRANLPIVKQLKIKTRIGNAIYPVGEKDGKLYLLAPAPVK